MSSAQTQNRLRRAATILRSGHPTAVPCDYCSHLDVPCFRVAPSSKCAECTRRGRSCVSSSWLALDKARDRLSAEIASDEKEREELFARLSALQARIEQKRKVRDQANRRVKEKLECLTEEVEESGGQISATEDVGGPELDLGSARLSCPLAFGDDCAPSSTVEVGEWVSAGKDISELDIDFGFAGLSSPFTWGGDCALPSRVATPLFSQES